MSTIVEHIPFVKAQIEHYDRMAVRFRSNPDKQTTYIEVAKKLRALLYAIENSDATTQNSTNLIDVGKLTGKLPTNFLSNPLTLSPTDYAGVEDDLVKELNITPSDKLESTIIDLINAAGGTLVLDKIILGVYYLTGEKHQRVSMTARLYRMAKKNLVYGVPKKKGVYTTLIPESGDDLAEEDSGEDSLS